MASTPDEIANGHTHLRSSEERFSTARAELRDLRSNLLASREEKVRAEARYDAARSEMRDWCERQPRRDGMLGCLDSAHECGAVARQD